MVDEHEHGDFRRRLGEKGNNKSAVIEAGQELDCADPDRGESCLLEETGLGLRQGPRCGSRSWSLENREESDRRDYRPIMTKVGGK